MELNNMTIDEAIDFLSERIVENFKKNNIEGGGEKKKKDPQESFRNHLLSGKRLTLPRANAEARKAIYSLEKEGYTVEDTGNRIWIDAVIKGR